MNIFVSLIVIAAFAVCGSAQVVAKRASSLRPPKPSALSPALKIVMAKSELTRQKRSEVVSNAGSSIKLTPTAGVIPGQGHLKFLDVKVVNFEDAWASVNAATFANQIECYFKIPSAGFYLVDMLVSPDTWGNSGNSNEWYVRVENSGGFPIASATIEKAVNDVSHLGLLADIKQPGNYMAYINGKKSWIFHGCEVTQIK